MVFAGGVIRVVLRREDFFAKASLAWLPSSEFAKVESRADAFLHSGEQAVYRKLKVQRRQISFLLGRMTAKSALAACVGDGFAAAETEIQRGVFDQPVVQGRFERTWAVSISHSEHLACSLAYPEEHPMAVDVERIDLARTTVMQSQIVPDEGDRAIAVCGSVELAATVVWTAKEALSKALRCGMTCPYELLETVDMSGSADGYTGRFKNFGQYRFQSWRRGDHVVTLVLPKRTEMEITLPDPL